VNRYALAVEGVVEQNGWMGGDEIHEFHADEMKNFKR
jgi:hypothetical protein